MNKKGLFLTFEGIDFSGKTTQIELLVNMLDSHSIKNITLREPGGTAIGEKIRNILLDKNSTAMASETELLLYSAARAQIVRESVEPKLQEGYVVILDRFFDSTIAYQGYGRQLALDQIEQITHFAVQKTIPDITFYFKLDLEEMYERKHKAGREDDRLEANERDFFERIIEGYEILAKTNPDRYQVLDAGKGKESIFEDLQRILKKRYQLF